MSKGFKKLDERDYLSADYCADRALEFDQNDSGALFLKSYSLFYMGDFQNSIEYFQHLIYSDPEDPQIALHLYNLGTAYYEIDDYQQSIRYFNKVLEYDSGTFEAYLYIGYSYMMLSDNSNAMLWIQGYLDAIDQTYGLDRLDPQDDLYQTVQGACDNLEQIKTFERNKLRYESLKHHENKNTNPDEGQPAEIREQPQGKNKNALFSWDITYYEPLPLAYYNTFLYLEVPSIHLRIENKQKYPVKVKFSAEYLDFSHPSVKSDVVHPYETKEIDLIISLTPREIEAITTITKFNLKYTLEYEEGSSWHILEEETNLIPVYPMDTMVWAMQDQEGDAVSLTDYIAVFVTPQSDAILELLSIAKEFADEEIDYGYASYGLDKTLAGYQYGGEFGDEEEYHAAYVDLQVKAIYNALKYHYEVSYLSATTSFGPEQFHQRVNMPDQSLHLSSANCIDGTVLMASALEALGIRPYIVIIPGHAYLAWSIYRDRTTISALETTLIGSADFEDARTVGDNNLDRDWDNLLDENNRDYEFIDIGACRGSYIFPMR